MSTTDIIGVWSDIAQFVVALVAIGAIIVALVTSNRQIKESRSQLTKQIDASNDQLTKQIEESRRLATEERQHQSCPIIVPIKEIENVPATTVEGRAQEYLYTAEAPPRKGNLSWGLTFPGNVPLEVSNIGMGPAFNVQCVLHGYENINEYQFIAWNNGPIGAGKDATIPLRHPRHGKLLLNRNDSLDGEYKLLRADTEPDPNEAIARLTISYHDLFGNKLASIFDYTSYHEWVRVSVSTPASPKFALDLKELNDQKKPKTGMQQQN